MYIFCCFGGNILLLLIMLVINIGNVGVFFLVGRVVKIIGVCYYIRILKYFLDYCIRRIFFIE